MSAPQPKPNPRIDPAVAFAARCEARALLLANGALHLHEAVDALQAAAVANGLVHEIGQDAVQAIMAAAFEPGAAMSRTEAARDDHAPRGTVEIVDDDVSRRAARSMVEALMFSLRSGVQALGRRNTIHRLSQLSDEQLRDVAVRLQKFEPHIASAWTADEIAVLIDVRSKADAENS